ncbi:hypothetical protein DPMN_012987 [Dreissena polymorpha]|uniref:Uncharacterized protein n=1 Tax=Dreissena polymorpha TaxID=45954 RepID=A0A9D4N926_DREPO|nr:hypothetical protein DPMN_012987 [Dreissena polymorpha]
MKLKHKRVLSNVSRRRNARPACRTPSHQPIGKLRYARYGRFSAIAARAISYVRLVDAQLRLKDHAELAGHVKALRIEARKPRPSERLGTD